MPNICFGKINVKGLSRNVDEFTNILKNVFNIELDENNNIVENV